MFYMYCPSNSKDYRDIHDILVSLLYKANKYLLNFIIAALKTVLVMTNLEIYLFIK